MKKISRQLTDFPLALDQESTPYPLNEFTPTARSLSDLNSNVSNGNPRSSGSRGAASAAVRMAKAVFVGDVGVGKTSLINRFCRDIFDENYKATVGIDYEMERFWILNSPFNLQIWDTAGQERFKCIAAAYYRGSNAVVTVFDASDLESLSTCQRWMDDAVSANSTTPLKFLLATKMDLVNEGHREKIFQMGSRMASLLGAEYWPVSSKSGENVERFFRRLAALTFEMGLASEITECFSRPPKQIQLNVGGGLRITHPGIAHPEIVHLVRINDEIRNLGATLEPEMEQENHYNCTFVLLHALQYKRSQKRPSEEQTFSIITMTSRATFTL